MNQIGRKFNSTNISWVKSPKEKILPAIYLHPLPQSLKSLASNLKNSQLLPREAKRKELQHLSFRLKEKKMAVQKRDQFWIILNRQNNRTPLRQSQISPFPQCSSPRSNPNPKLKPRCPTQPRDSPSILHPQLLTRTKTVKTRRTSTKLVRNCRTSSTISRSSPIFLKTTVLWCSNSTSISSSILTHNTPT